MKKENALPCSKKKYTNYALRIGVVVILFIAMALLLNERYWLNYENHQFNGTYKYTESSYIYKKGSTLLEEKLTVPAFRHMEKGEAYSISTVLTYDGSKDEAPTCFFFVDHMYCKVYVDGETVFSYMSEDLEKHDKGKSPGNVYVAAKLPRDCLGKELKIEFYPSLDADIDYQLPCPTFSDSSTHLNKMFWEELPHNIIGVLTLFLGMGCIFYSSVAMKGTNYREGIFIGVFAILFGFYNITESDFDFYMISNPYFTYVMDYSTFTLIPIFFFSFLRERMTGIQKKIALGLIIKDAVMFVTELLLHFTGVVDMREFLPILHIMFFLDIVINMILISTCKNSPHKKSLVFQIVPIAIGMVMDFFVYYMHWQLGTSDSTFTAIGVIFFLISEMIYAWKHSIEIYTESTRSRVYQQMAYVDSLTGIGNRRAFEMLKLDILSGIKSYDSIAVVSADLNNLKITNDRMGHASGDFLIRSAANVLTDMAADCGEVYRVGGDEFVAFLYNIRDEKLTEKIEELQNHIDEINSDSSVKLDMAVGICVTKGELGNALEEADKNMYEDKKLKKLTDKE